MRAGVRAIARVVLAAAALVCGAAAALAQSRHATLVVDGNTGTVLHAESADDLRYPASLTKMMTIYLAFEQIEAKRLSYNTRIKISQEAASAAPSKLDLDPGEEITLLDAIKALITKSANDIAVAVAEHIGGDQRSFARMMTAKARQLGMSSTVFRNASGLPDAEQVTTARDMVRLAMRLHDDFPRHYHLFALRSFSFDGTTYANHNTLLGTYAGTEGLKTGYTRMSGFNVVTSVKRGERHLFAAVFGGASAGSRNATMRSILDRTLLRAATVRTRKPNPPAPALVATPRPVQRPALVLAKAPPPPEPAQAPRPAPAARPVPPAASAAAIPARPAAPETQPQPPSAAVAEAPRIDIARVRPVMVARRAPDARRPAGDQSTGPVQLASASAAPGITEVVKRRPSTSDPSAAPEAAPPVVPQPSAPARTAVQQPGTLQAQAAALSRQQVVEPQPPAPRPLQIATARLNGPASAPQPAAVGTFQLQIGAFASQAEAERALAAIRAKAAAAIGTAQPVTIPVTKDARKLYRARFSGFTAQAAATACLELRRQSVDCFVMKAE